MSSYLDRPCRSVDEVLQEREIRRAQRRMELLIGKEWLMDGVFCLDCGRPWKEWADKENDHCGCTKGCQQ